MAQNCVREYYEDFLGTIVVDGTDDVQGGWSIDLDGTGTPTAVTVTGEPTGGIKLTLTSGDVDQGISLDWNDILGLDIDNLQTYESRVKVANVDSTDATGCVVAFGLASAHNADEDAVTANAYFKIEAATSASNIVCESDDGTHDNNDVASGQTLSTSYKRFKIDFSNGKSDVRFYMDDGSGQFRRVASSTTFDMSGYAGGLQPVFRILKASGTATPSITVDEVCIRYKK